MNMKTINRIAFSLALLAVFLALPTQAQTATPNTTLCGAQTKTATTVCLTSTTGVVNQTGVYVDQEYELVQLGGNQAVCTGPCQVPVSRNNRNSGSGPTAHLNAAIAWVALTPGQSVVPGSNGFELGTNMADVGPCTRTAVTYLPHVWVNRGIKRDCNGAGVWVDYAPASGLDYPSSTPLVALTANQALSVSSGNYALTTKAGVIALTLTAPTAGVQDGMRITIKAYNGANADTLTATSLIQTGGGSSPYTTATFGATTAYVGATLTLEAYQGFWFVVASSNVTFS
jgi:hypothetical protein